MGTAGGQSHFNRARLFKCAQGIFIMVVLSEGLDKRRVEGGEDIWGGWDVESHGRHISMCVHD